MTMSTASKTHAVRSPQQHQGGHAPTGRVQGGLLDPALLAKALPDAFRKFDPELTAIAWTAAVNKVIEPEFLSNSSFTVSQALRQLHKLFSQGLFVRESESARVVGRPAARSRARNRASASVFALNA